VKLEPRARRFPWPSRPETAGKHTVAGQLSFSVCTDDNAMIESASSPWRSRRSSGRGVGLSRRAFRVVLTRLKSRSDAEGWDAPRWGGDHQPKITLGEPSRARALRGRSGENRAQCRRVRGFGSFPGFLWRVFARVRRDRACTQSVVTWAMATERILEICSASRSWCKRSSRKNAGCCRFASTCRCLRPTRCGTRAIRPAICGTCSITSGVRRSRGVG